MLCIPEKKNHYHAWNFSTIESHPSEFEHTGITASSLTQDQEEKHVPSKDRTTKDTRWLVQLYEAYFITQNTPYR